MRVKEKELGALISKNGSLRNKIMTIDAQISFPVFTLFAALNALGYDKENNDAEMYYVRRRVRAQLRYADWEEKYPHLVYAASAYHPHFLLSAILQKGEKAKKESFLTELKLFSNKSAVKNLWEEAEEEYRKQTETLLPIFTSQVKKLITFLPQVKEKIEKVIIIVNLLDAYWCGYGVETSNVGFVVVGPGATDNDAELVRHELLHLLAPKFEIPGEFIATNFSDYQSQETLKEEYVVRALCLLYKSKALNKDISQDITNTEQHFPHIRNVMSHLNSTMSN